MGGKVDGDAYVPSGPSASLTISRIQYWTRSLLMEYMELLLKFLGSL